MQLAELRQFKTVIEAIAVARHIRNIRVFGSVARGEQNDSSDIDLLVTIGNDIGWGLGGFKMDLEELLGVSVDVIPDEDLNHHLRDNILREAVPL